MNEVQENDREEMEDLNEGGKEKFQRFMSCLIQACKDKNEFLNPKTMDEVIRNAILLFSQFK